MNLKCINTNQQISRCKVKAICKNTGYTAYGRCNRIARVNLKWILYCKMADRPFEVSKIKHVLGDKWFKKLGLNI